MVHLFNRRRWIQIFKPAWQWSEHWIRSQETQILIPACFQHSLCHRSHFPSLDHILTYKLSGEASWSQRSPPVLTSLIIWPEPGDSHCRGWGFLEQFSWSPSCQKHVGVFYSEKNICVQGVKLEKSTSDCIPGGNYLESRFRSASQRKIRKTENTSWEIYLVSWDPLDQSLKSPWTGLIC